MKLTSLLATIYLITACTSPTPTPTTTPARIPTETSLPTEAPSSVPTPSDVFGAIPLNSVQAYSLEPIAKAIFEQTLQEYVTTGTIQAYRVDRLSVFPSGSGGLIAEIMYSLRTDNDPWAQDFGSLAADGWIAGKCSRFDLVATEVEHQLKNKRLCS